MRDSMIQPRTAGHTPWTGTTAQRLNRLGGTVREQLAHYLSEIAEFWGRQPIDRFWPPHP